MLGEWILRRLRFNAKIFQHAHTYNLSDSEHAADGKVKLWQQKIWSTIWIFACILIVIRQESKSIECTHVFISVHKIAVLHYLTTRSFPPLLPSPPQHLQSTIDAVTPWLHDDKRAVQQQTNQVLAFLKEDYLRSVPLPQGAFFTSILTVCRHWFCVFAAWVLGWICRRDEM